MSPTTRHDLYAADALIDSTEAARILRSHPHDPLAFHRLDALRATGRLRPVDPGVDVSVGPRFLRSEVELCAHPWEFVEQTICDPLGPARGIALALAVSLLAGGIVALAVYGIVRVVL